jgi:hypothetical protein
MLQQSCPGLQHPMAQQNWVLWQSGEGSLHGGASQ